jgi:hypothetical protein
MLGVNKGIIKGTSGEKIPMLGRLPVPFLNPTVYYDGTPYSGDTITDISGNALNGTITGATWTQLTNGAWVLAFDGVDDYIEVAHNANQLLTTGGTILAWIKPYSLGENPATEAGRIVDKSTNTTGGNGYSFRMGATNTLRFIINGGTQIFAASGVISNFGTWYHVVATWDAAGYVTIYVNGVQSGTSGISADPAGITTTNAIRIGNRSGATDRTFDGLIGEVSIYNRALSAEEIAQYHNATKWRYS